MIHDGKREKERERERDIVFLIEGMLLIFESR